MLFPEGIRNMDITRQDLRSGQWSNGVMRQKTSTPTLQYSNTPSLYLLTEQEIVGKGT
jgi:hypothetical protein